MNGYKYKPSTVLFDERVKDALFAIQKDYNNGKTITKTDYAYKVKQAIMEFYEKMGRPTYEFIPASDVPSFVHFSKMVSDAKLDMKNMVTGCEQLNEVLTDMNSSMMEETSIIKNNILLIDNKVQEIEKRIKSLTDASSMIFTDSFESNVADDKDITTSNDDRLHFADVSDGVCSLASTNYRTEEGFTVSIMNSSNGFPGNTHEVYETTNGLKYVGETDPKMNLTSLLNSDPKDCFEFEMYNVDDSTRAKTSSVGFRYKEGISWVTEDEELNLDLKITFKKTVRINALRINGQPKVNYQTDYPTIKEIIIKDDYAGVQTINYGGPLLEKTVINFKPQTVKEVTIRITQKDNNITKVARSFGLSIDSTKIPYFVNDEFKDFTQIDKPTVSIESLGLIYNTKDKSIIYPSTDNGNNFMNKEYLKSNLFYSNTNVTDSDKIFVETINAYRYVIGISYIGFDYSEYADSGVYISSSFEVEEPIKKVTLNAFDSIPSSFYEVEDEATRKKNPIIAYYLSFNEEEEWYQIYPRAMYDYGPCSIVINSHLNIESRNPNITYIDRLIDAYSVRLKIQLRRPKEISDESPIVNEYNIDIDGEE